MFQSDKEMKIKRFSVNPLQENCYIASSADEAVIIDCGAYYPEELKAIDNYIEENSLRLTHILNTHMHFDHVLGLKHLNEKYGLGYEAHSADFDLYENLEGQLQMFTMGEMKAEKIAAEKFLKENDIVDFGESSLKVIHTPGHTPGGICFYAETEGVLFSGDSLFQCSIGRTDFPGGSAIDLIESLKEKVLTLPDDVKVFTGHGGTTTIGDEKRYNMYLR